jgi:GAF domain-containing protein/anti-anti-sigma regulatory factor
MTASNNNEDERGRAERRLQTQYAVTRALAESDRLRDAAPRILQAVCESLDWEVGALWRVDREADALRCVETWHVPGLAIVEFEEASKGQQFVKGTGLPGHVWETGEPTWVTDMASSNFVRAAFAEKEGLHGAFAFPITLRNETLGVMEFFSRELRGVDEDVLDMMGGISSQVGQFIERKLAEEAQAERARVAALGADIGTALIQGDSLRDMLQRSASTLVKHLDAAFARIWTLNVKENVLELQASAGLYTHLDGAHSRVPVGRFKIGLIAEERRAHLTNSVVGDERVGDQDWAKREGMVAFAGYPLIVDNRLVGVMAMFARHTLTQTALEGMEAVGNIIALGIERKRAEQTLLEQTHALALLNEERGRMIEEVSTPVVPVWRGVLILPIVGSLDTERMQRATDTALREVMRLGAHSCIIDITGARIVDSHAVANLSNLVSALKLIGAEAIVTGVTAHAAHTLVGLGVDFTGMKTRRTLAEALADIIKSQSNSNKDGYSTNGITEKLR